MYPVKNRSFGNFPLLLGVHFIKSLESEVTRRFNHIMTGGYSVSHNGIKLPSKGELRKKSSSFALAYSACLLSTAILARHGETVMRQLAQRENELYRFAHRRRCFDAAEMELFPLPLLFIYLLKAFFFLTVSIVEGDRLGILQDGPRNETSRTNFLHPFVLFVIFFPLSSRLLMMIFLRMETFWILLAIFPTRIWQQCCAWSSKHQR